ncbi:MAG: DUF2851 family protein [Opitutus sp.]
MLANPEVGSTRVFELPGLYGPFTFPEKLLQKIWFRRSFQDTAACTVDGRRITLLQSGKWNLLGGPDFKNARLRFGDGPEMVGDVEIHLHAVDWLAHHHADDIAYDRVILHVVLFAPPSGHVTRSRSGAEIPVLVLLPLLHHDLEEYAAEEAIEQLANRPAAQIVERLGPLPFEEVNSLLRAHAEQRWAQKVRYASIRIQKLGWIEACHQTAMDIMGYRFNRAPMLRAATLVPFAHWRDGGLDLEALFKTVGGWSLQGQRPANHPRLRLHQYSTWVAQRPRWPDTLTELAQSLPRSNPEAATGDFRRRAELPLLRETWTMALTGGAIRGTRFDNLLTDGFFPLLAANGTPGLRDFWFHWLVGDVPPLWRQALRELEVFSGRARPACHGMTQGLLGWLIERERSALVAKGRSA